jgi:hypothetical protein
VTPLLPGDVWVVHIEGHNQSAAGLHNGRPPEHAVVVSISERWRDTPRRLAEVTVYAATLARVREQVLRALASAWGFEIELRRVVP